MESYRKENFLEPSVQRELEGISRFSNDISRDLGLLLTSMWNGTNCESTRNKDDVEDKNNVVYIRAKPQVETCI